MKYLLNYFTSFSSLPFISYYISFHPLLVAYYIPPISFRLFHLAFSFRLFFLAYFSSPISFHLFLFAYFILPFSFRLFFFYLFLFCPLPFAFSFRLDVNKDDSSLNLCLTSKFIRYTLYWMLFYWIFNLTSSLMEYVELSKIIGRQILNNPSSLTCTYV